MLPDVPTSVCDTECFRDYWLLMLRGLRTGREMVFEQYPGKPLDTAKLRYVLANTRIVTFNGLRYDELMIRYALTGRTCEELKELSDYIIQAARGMPAWKIAKELGLPRLQVDHIDLIEVAPGQGSLKVYGGRLHAPHLQDMPIPITASVTEALRPVVRSYCGNDLYTTALLFSRLKPVIDLRAAMSEQYGADLRSKSDAQIAEFVLRKEVSDLKGYEVGKPVVQDGLAFRYEDPGIVRFQTPELQRVFELVKAAEFKVEKKPKKRKKKDEDAGETLSVQMPPELDGLEVSIGEGRYRLGIGGLHSSEKCAAHLAGDDHYIIDRDVASYYPNLILALLLFPQHMGEEFLKAYRGIVVRRLAAKRNGDKATNEALKIVINSSFGKFGNAFSVLFSPNLLIQTTVTGQLLLLMLIEALELRGIRVISANTDGIVIRCPKHRKQELDELVWHWELDTGLETEETLYSAIYSRDVNNYAAVKAKDGSIKGKGVYAPLGLSKNPVNTICTKAVLEFISKGTPVAQTILGCTDIREFVTLRAVRDGALYYPDKSMSEDWVEIGYRLWSLHGLPEDDPRATIVRDRKSMPRPVAVPAGEPIELGRIARWYYARGAEGGIYNAKSLACVPRAEGVREVMTLPDTLPGDVDHDWYIAEAFSILKQIGYRQDA